MTTADTPASTERPPTAPVQHPAIPADQAPAPVRTLLRKLGPGWIALITPGAGHDVRGGLSEDTDGEGKRRRVTRTVAVDSVALRARHDDGRQVRIVWAVEHGATTPAGKAKGPTFVCAWRGRHDREHGPAELAATEVPAYMTADGPAAALVAVEQLRADRLAAAAARRAPAPVHELHPHLDDDQAEDVAA